MIKKDIEGILDRIKRYADLQTEKEIAELLGIGSSDFSNRKKRGTLLPLIAEWCLGEEVNAEWLLKGTNVQIAAGSGNIQVGAHANAEVTGRSPARQAESLRVGDLDLEEIKELLRYAPIDYLIEIRSMLLKYKELRNGS